MSFNAKKILLAGSAFLALTAYGTAAQAACVTTGQISADCDLEASTTGAITIDNGVTVTITKTATLGNTIDGDAADDDGVLEAVSGTAITVTQTADIGGTTLLNAVTVGDNVTWNVTDADIKTDAGNVTVGGGASGTLNVDASGAALEISSAAGVVDILDGGRLDILDSTNTVTLGAITIQDGGILDLSDTTDIAHGAIDGGAAGVGTLIINGDFATDDTIGANDALALVSLTGAQTFTVGHTLSATDITGDASAQVIDITGAVTITGDIALGNGADELEFTNTATIAGDVSGVNTVTVEAGKTATFTGTAITGAPAISLEGANSAIVFNNGAGAFTGTITGDADANKVTLTAGTFTGNMNLGNGANVVTLTAGTLGSTSNTITGGTAVDTLALNGGTLNSDVSLGADADAVTVGGTAIAVGDILGGDGANTFIFAAAGDLTVKGAVTGFTDVELDNNTTLTLDGSGKTYGFNVVTNAAGDNNTLELVNGTLTGDVTLQNGVNAFTVTGGAFTGAYTGGTGNDTFTVNLTNATDIFTVADTVAFGGGGTDAFTLTKGDVRINADVGGTDFNMTVAADATARFDADVDTGTGDYTQENDVTFVLRNDTAGTGFGSLTTGGARTLTNKVLNIEVGADAAIGDGDTFTIFTDTGAGDVQGSIFTLSGLSPNSFLTFAADAVADDDLIITATANNVADVVVGLEGAGADYLGGVGSTLDGLNAAILAGTANNDIEAAFANLQAADGDVAAKNVLESLTPTVDGSQAVAAINVAGEVADVLDTRLASLSTGQTGVAAGNGGSGHNFWMQGFGKTATQDQRDGVDGFDSDTYGAAIGLDTENVIDNGIVGVALAYATTDAESENGASTDSEIDSYQISLYGQMDVAPATFVQGSVGYGRNNIDQTRHNVGGVAGQNVTADFDSDQFMARVSTGRHYETGYGFTLTPKLSANYVHLSTDSYDEDGTLGVALTDVDTDDINIFELGIGADMTWDVANNDGSVLQPKLHAGYRYDVIGDEVSTTATFAGGGAAFATEGYDPAQGTFDLGAGVTYFSSSNWDLKADYNFEIKEDYDAHAGLVRASFKF